MVKKTKQKNRDRRHRRIRGKISGTSKRPRLCVFRSSKHIYAQLIDDEKNKILAISNDMKMKKKGAKVAKKVKVVKGTKEIERSRKLALGFEVGKLIAKKAKDLNIEEVVFDRGGYKYHGRVKSLADGARAGGLKF